MKTTLTSSLTSSPVLLSERTSFTIALVSFFGSLTALGAVFFGSAAFLATLTVSSFSTGSASSFRFLAEKGET